MAFSFPFQNWNTVLPQQYWVIAVSSLFFIPILTFIYTNVKSSVQLQRNGSDKSPPIVPYILPIIGNLASFASNPAHFANSITTQFGFKVPVRVRLGPFTAYFISNARHFETILKGARNLNSSSGIIMTLQNLFDLPARAARFMYTDNSGLAATPLPGTTIAPHNRIGHLRHSAAMKFLYGSHLTGITSRFIASFAKGIADDDTITADEWLELPDLVQFLKIRVLTAATSSLCGPHFFELNPDFARDFWEFYSNVPTFIKGLPKWWNPTAQRARTRCLDSITKWHKYAWSHIDHARIKENDPDWEEYFGAKIMRTRYSYGIKMKDMSDKARAAEDLAMLFATNANSVPATIFFIIDLLRDPGLLKRTHDVLDKCRLAEPDISLSNNGKATILLFDVPKLTNSPLMQSAYAETLRLRMAMALMRSPEKSDFLLDGWRFPKDKLIFLLTSTAAHNTDLWNSGTKDEPHPLSEFWADRFLVYPNDENSGPLRRDRRKEALGDNKPDKTTFDTTIPTAATTTTNDPIFSMEGLAGGWIPYGGGNRMCPGRFFAKNEMIVSFAMIVDNYDIELKTPDGWVPEPDMRFFAAGVMPPKDLVPCRIRRRKRDCRR